MSNYYCALRPFSELCYWNINIDTELYEQPITMHCVLYNSIVLNVIELQKVE